MDKKHDPYTEEKIRKMALRRVGFKKHLAVYLLSMLIIWLTFSFVFYGNQQVQRVFVFGTALWTVIIVFHHLFVYRLCHGMLDREVKKIREELFPENSSEDTTSAEKQIEKQDNQE